MRRVRTSVQSMVRREASEETLEDPQRDISMSGNGGLRKRVVFANAKHVDWETHNC